MTIVRKTRSEIRPLTPERAAELRALAERPAHEIDVSDIPPLDRDFWDNATPGRFYRPVKTQVTLRIDSDILHWLKRDGGGYQTRLNAILRAVMLQAQRRGTTESVDRADAATHT